MNSEPNRSQENHGAEVAASETPVKGGLASPALLGAAALMLVTFIWGTTFVIIRESVDDLPPANLILIRFSVAAGISLLVFRVNALLHERRVRRGHGHGHSESQSHGAQTHGPPSQESDPSAAGDGNRAEHDPTASQPGGLWKSIDWKESLELGFWLFIGYYSQALGLQFTSAGRGGFITGLSVVLVPVILGLMGKPVTRRIAIASLVAILGLGLISSDGMAPNRGDLLILLTALAYAIFIVRLDSFLERISEWRLAMAQIWGVLIFIAPVALLEAYLRQGNSLGAGRPAGSSIGFADLAGIPMGAPRATLDLWAGLSTESWLAAIYLGVAATMLTVGLQTYGQARVGAAGTAIIYTAEPLWAALIASLTIGEEFGLLGWIGGSLIVLGMLLGQDELWSRWASSTTLRPD